MNRKTKNYIPRVAEHSLKHRLNSSGCVIVTGPKACGKATLCRQVSRSEVLLKTNRAIDLAKADPLSALKGKTPHLIDEWQKVPEIFNLIRNDLDEDYEFGKYILTGSTTPLDPSKIQHNGAGRVSFLRLKPFSLYESGESNGIVSLSSLFNEPNKPITSLYPEDNRFSLPDIAFLMCRGGWPISCKAKKEYAIAATANYFHTLFSLEGESDDFAKFLEKKDIDLLRLILKEASRNISTQAKHSKRIKDILSSGERKTLDDETFNNYYFLLKKLFLIYDREARNKNLRSSVAVRVAPTIHFFDTSIALAAIGIGPKDLLNDLNSFGFYFEDFAVRDLSIYRESIQGRIRHYRDSNGLEVDCLAQIPNGDYAAIEVKIYSPENIKKGISSLTRFTSQRKENGFSGPLFSAIITTHGPCYRSPEGIYIIPITCLKD